MFKHATIFSCYAIAVNSPNLKSQSVKEKEKTHERHIC